jgi:hypothetical protein
MPRRHAVIASEGCARRCAPAEPEPILALDAFGHLGLAGAQSAQVPVEGLADRVAHALGRLVGRPIDVVSAVGHPIGHQHVVSVASRENGRRGPELRTGAARHHDAAQALAAAIVAAHLGDDTLLAAATRRFVADGVLRSAVLVEGGVHEAFGAADRHDPLVRMAAGEQSPGRAHPPGAEPVTVVLELGTTVLAADLAPGADPHAVASWWRDVGRCANPRPSIVRVPG